MQPDGDFGDPPVGSPEKWCPPKSDGKRVRFLVKQL